MPKTYRIGVIGFAMGHVNGLMRHFAEQPNCELVACADLPPTAPEQWEWRGSRTFNLNYARSEIGIEKVYDDYREMLERERFDIVIFCPENARHPEIAEAIAAKGAHMLTEKPMAADLPGALRMVRAARANGVELFINWPTTWSPAIRKAKDLVEQGAIGTLWEVRARFGSMGPMSHGSYRPGPNGEQIEISETEKGTMWWHRYGNGGGALLDYCSYGACLTRWYLGQPAVAAIGMTANVASHYGSTEDNAVITVRFPKALALIESTWSCVDHGVPTGPILLGTTGTIVVERQRERQAVRIARGRGVEPETVDPGSLPAGRENIAKEILHHLETGEPVHQTLDAALNLEAMAILDAGIRSAASGKMELVNDMTWCIG